MNNTEPGRRPVHIVRDLHISDVSIVDKAAGRGTRVVLAKRDDGHKREEDMPTMTQTEISKRAGALWGVYCSLIQKRDGCTMSEAIDRAGRDPIGAEALRMSLDANLAEQQRVINGDSEGVMQTRTHAEFAKRGYGLWTGYVDLLKAQHKCTTSKAIDIALESELGRELYHAGSFAKGADAVGIGKLGSGAGIPDLSFDTPSERVDSGGRVVSRTRNAPHGGSNPQPFDPHDFTSSTETGAQALNRLRVAGRYNAAVEAKIKSGKSRSQAIREALAEIPEAAKLSAADVIRAREMAAT
jgi:hypothetical protein